MAIIECRIVTGGWKPVILGDYHGSFAAEEPITHLSSASASKQYYQPSETE